MAETGLDMNAVGSMRFASPLFQLLYDKLDQTVRASRHVISEDTLHALGNGEIGKIKTVSGPNGVVTTDEGPIYSERALLAELAANDPKYRPQQAVAVAPVINISLSAPRPDGPVIEVKEAQPAEGGPAKPRIEYFKP